MRIAILSAAMAVSLHVVLAPGSTAEAEAPTTSRIGGAKTDTCRVLALKQHVKGSTATRLAAHLQDPSAQERYQQTAMHYRNILAKAHQHGCGLIDRFALSEPKRWLM
ncbi:hypothetical protein [Halomonas sp. I5-271120]|uniref:hypothetical protein n=1 Tax=Halomonas sp. I5-271120 TaxID=3061632 RepID=UPI002714AF23|nr:hypothetical protein [Halomonas sp. I5-271120]